MCAFSLLSFSFNLVSHSNAWPGTASMLINVYQTYTGPLSVQAQYSRLCPISSSFRYNGSLVTWTVVCLTTATFKPLILTTWIQEPTVFYKFHAACIEDTTLNSSSVVLLVVTVILCLATCYLVTTRSMLYIVTGMWFQSCCSTTDFSLWFH
jgi:hypothetical protein